MVSGASKRLLAFLLIFAGTPIFAIKGDPATDPEAAAAYKQAMDALNALDPCSRAMVERLVLNQGPLLSHASFHRLEHTFEKLGIRFDRLEHEDIPIKVEENLASYQA